MDFIIILLLIAVLFYLIKSRRKKEPLGELLVTIQSDVSVDSYSGDEQRDAWEFDGWESEETVPVSASLDIEYKDGKGQVTNRLVDINQCMFSSDGSGMFRCFCHLRNANRYFRFDRILSAMDRSTGEVIKDVRKYLEDQYESSAHKSLRKTLDEKLAAVRILMYVGKADGQLRKAERDIINDMVRYIANDNRITDEEIAQELNGYGNPSLQVFRVAVGAVAREGSALKSTLYEAAEKIVATQKTVHTHETEALAYIKKRFELI